MIDICTVVFQEEIPLLKIQAQSLVLFANQIGLRNIYVVVNDDETVAQQIDPAWWGPLASHVLVVPRSTFSTEWVTDGWVSQQLWKMLAASLSYNTYTMVLDAKTILTKPLIPEELFDDTGRLRVGRLPLYPVFEPAKKIAETLFDIELTEQLGPGGVPFFFHNDTVRAMIVDVNYRTKTSFPHWFQKTGMITEFVLYSAYVQFRYGNMDLVYSRESALKPANLCHSDISNADRLLTAFEQSSTTSVGVHRRAWTQLSQAQQQRYRLALIDKGVLAAWEL